VRFVFAPQAELTRHPACNKKKDVKHTKPIVERLADIMRGASQQVVVLSGFDTDPMRLTSKVSNVMGDIAELCKLPDVVAAYARLDGERPPLTVRLDDLARLRNACELPTDLYFSRLWCYVERLAIRGEAPDQCVNGRGGRDAAHFASALQSLRNDLVLVAEALRFPLDITVTVFQPRLYRLRELCYCVNNIERVLNSLRNVWGIGGTRDAAPLDPFTGVETLDCFCDADRVSVYAIECQLRACQPSLVDFAAALQLALGRPVYGRAMGSMIREPFGKSRQVSALELAGGDASRVLTDAKVLVDWVAASQRVGNVAVRLRLGALLGVQHYACFVIRKNTHRHFVLSFARGKCRIVLVADGTVPRTWPVPKTFKFALLQPPFRCGD